MARSSSRSGARTSSSRPAPAPQHAPTNTNTRSYASPPPPPPPPAPAPQAQPPAPAAGGSGGGLMSGIAGSIMSGMASGVGFSVANRAVDAVLGPRKTEVVHTHVGDNGAPASAQAPRGAACTSHQQALNDCLAKNSDILSCQSYVDMLKQCQNGSGMA